MADDIQSNIRLDIDSTDAISSLKNLQRQISAFHTSLAKGSADAAAASSLYQQKLINSINATGKFSAELTNIKSTTEAFTTSLERNKFSMGEYFRYAGGASKTFGKLFKKEFDTVTKVAEERVKTLQTQYIQMGRDANGALRAIKVRPLALDMENLSTKTAIAAQKQQLFNQLMKQGSTNLLNFGKNTQWAGRQLMVGFTVPLTMLGSVAAKTFMDMEKAVIKFKRVYGDMATTTSDTNKMVMELKGLAQQFTKYGVAVSDTMDMAAQAAAMGKMGAELTAQVAQATKLAVLGGVEQAQALETTISLTNAFGVAAEDLSGKIDFLNAVENQTVTSIEDLTIAVPKAGPVIQQLGGNVEDLAFFLTAMKEGGINASEGANALKSGLASMINPTAKASEFLAGFGVNLQGIVEANKGNVKGTVVEFAKALDKLDPLNRARAIEQLFGKFQFARISTLFKNVVNEGSQANKVLGLARQTTQELAILSEREMKKIEDSPMFKFQKAIEDIKVSLVPLGEAFLKAVTPLVQFGTKILDKFNAMDEGAKSFVTNLVGVVGVIGPALLMGFGLVANGVANVMKLFTGLKTIFNGVGNSSEDVATETSYMTQAQIEAAAVAQSLDQAHASLIQRFSVEATALEALIQSYNRAIAAQAAFSGTPGGGPVSGNTGKKKFATGGIIRGKGTGTSDEIPLMASNGEAIIPAEVVKQNPTLISALISGKKIGRFATGGVVGNVTLGDGSVKQITASSQAELKNISDSIATYGQSLKKAGLGMEELNDIIDNFNSIGDEIPKSLATFRKTASVVNESKGIGDWQFTGENRFDLSKKQRMAKSDFGSGAVSGQRFTGNEEFFAARGKSQEFSLAKEGAALIASEMERLFVAKGIKSPEEAKIAAKIANKVDKAHVAGGTQSDKLMGESGWLSTIAEPHGVNQTTSTFSRGPEKLAFFKEAAQQLVDAEELTKEAMDSMLDKMSHDMSLTASELVERGKVFDQMRTGPGADKYGKMFGGTSTGVSMEAEANVARTFYANDPRTATAGQMSVQEKAANAAKLLSDKQAVAPLVKPVDSSKIIADANALGQAIPDGMAKGVKESAPEAQKASSDLANGFLLEAKSALGIASPSKKFWEIGKNVVEGFANGVKDNLGQATSAMDQFQVEMDPNDPFASSGTSFLPPAPGGGADPFGDPNAAPVNWDASSASKIDKLGDKATGAATTFGKKVAGGAMNALEKGWMKFAGEKLAKAAGQTITNTKGEVIYDGRAEDLKSRGLDENGNAIQDVRVVSDTSQKGKTTVAGASSDGERILSGSGAELTEKDIQRATRNQAFGRISGGVAKTAGVATAVTGAASMIPGAIGETAQKVAGPLAAFSTLTSFIQGPVSAAIVALIAVIGGVMFAVNAVNESFKKSQQEAIKLQTAMTGSTKSIRKLSEFSGKVSAGELMDRVRKQRTTLLQTAPGKTTFGESFVKSDQGSELLQNARTQIANNKGNKGQTTADLSNQLTMAVASGALSMEQARSLAANVASELGDMKIGLDIQANLVSMLGPDGTDVTKNPIEVAAKLRVQSVDKLNKDMDVAKTAASKDKIWSGGENTKANRELTAGGAALASAGAGAGIGALIGAIPLLSVATAGLSVAAGAAIGTVAGAITGAVTASASLEESAKRAGAMSGAVIADMAQALASQKEMMDVLDAYYLKKLAEAEAEGDITEYKRLQLEYDEKKNGLADQQAQTADSIKKAYVGSSTDMREAIRTGQKETMATQFKDNPMQNMYVTPLEQQIEDAKGKVGLKGDQEVLIRTNVINENMTPEQAVGFMSLFGTDDKSMKAGMEIMTNLGGAAAAEVTSLAGLIEDPKVKAQFLMDIKATGKDKKQADSIMKLVGNVGRNSAVFKTDAVISYYTKPANKKSADELNRVLGELDAQKVTTVEKAYEIMPELKQSTTDKNGNKLKAFNEEYFNKLKGEGQKELYVNTIAVWMNVNAEGLKDDEGFKKWLQENGWKWQDHSPVEWRRLYAEAMGQKVTIEAPAADTTATTPKPTGGGGGTPSSVLDDLTRKLKEIRQIQVKVTAGWSASAKELTKWLGGNKDIKIFQGMKQQMRAAGAGEDLIELIAGMDPAEYEKKKNQLFEFDKKGNITKLKDLAKTTGKALKEIALGEFQNAQVKITKDIGNQSTALTRLVANGLEVADAYSVVEDAALAAAIATKQLSDTELKKLIKDIKAATAAMKVYQATKAVKTSNEDVAQNNKVIAQLAAGKYSDAQRKAILDNKDLQTLFLNKNTSKDAYNTFVQGLSNAVNEKQFTINAKKLTIEGLEELFQEKFDMAMERINAQETKINIAFDTKTKGDQDLIKQTQDKISDYNYQIDDLEASLKPIEEAEEKINEQYDKRIEALDKVASLNEDAAREQKQQLSLADALAQGDISAAARAIQESKQANATAELEKQKKALEEGREKRLAGLVNAQGLTRVQVEEKIKGLRDNIFKLEEKSLEPAQRRVELAERERDALLATWEAEKARLDLARNNVDVSKTNTTDYKNALTDAEKLATDVVNGIANGGNVAGTGSGVVEPYTGPENTVVCPTPTKTKPAAKTGYTHTWDTKKCVWVTTKKAGSSSTTSTTSTAAKVVTPVTPVVKPNPNISTGGSYIGSQFVANTNVVPTAAQAKAAAAKGYKPTTIVANVPKAGVPATIYSDPTKNQTVKLPAGAVVTSTVKNANGTIATKYSIPVKKSMGGMMPKYFAVGGAASGTDTIPAMLTPGEFVVRKYAVDKIGVDNLRAINRGASVGDSVYNYDINISVSKSNANEDDIARAVIAQIKSVDSQRIRGNRFYGGN